MPRTTSTTRSGATRRGLRSLALGLAAAAVATTAAAGLGQGPSSAQADPGDTFLAIGSEQLLQSEDLAAIRVPLDRMTVDLNLDSDFSGCLGEGNSWTQTLPGSPKPIGGFWTSRRDRNKGLSQSIAQAKTPAQAKRYAETLTKEAIRNCQQGKSPWDFHYGRTQSSKVGSGSATWALHYRGGSTRPDGGIVVFHKGTNFGILEVTGTWGPADELMESVAKMAVSNLYPQGE